ncbi:inositol polyphosphate multikinase-like [Garra rufa]|uniref:inositol polyphosphate multikinase-like n=1 Tax=Garra rufa TaxID=137080 RepID=UPI003CCE757E
MSADGQIMDSSSRTLEKLKNNKNGPVKQVLLDGCVPFSHQVAGHKCGINNTGVLQHPDGTILKQLQAPPRGPREMNFYTQVFAKDCTDKRLLELQQHLPKFFGTWAPRESPHASFSEDQWKLIMYHSAHVSNSRMELMLVNQAPASVIQSDNKAST